MLVVGVFWPAVSIHVQQSRAPLVLSASHTSTVAEQLLSVLAVMQSLPHTRHVVTQLIVDQLDSITSLVSSPASQPAISLSLTVLNCHIVSVEVVMMEWS